MAIEIKEFVGHKPKNVKEQSEKKTVKNTKKAQTQVKPTKKQK